jgi:hypothetical protein
MRFSYWAGLADLVPLAQMLIAPDRWVASARGKAALVRHFPVPDAQALAGIDQCLAYLVALSAEERGALETKRGPQGPQNAP